MIILAIVNIKVVTDEINIQMLLKINISILYRVAFTIANIYTPKIGNGGY